MDICLTARRAQNFRCDGRACQSLCCKNWRIAIDEATIEKFRGIANESIRTDVLAGLKESDGRHFAKLRDNGDCYYLRPDGLCRLQHDFGETFLADVCAEYPRITFRLTDDYVEQSLTITCPVAARIILLPDEPLEFTEKPLEKKREGFIFDMRDKNLPSIEELSDIQGIGASILQDRHYTIDERLFLLSAFCEELDKKSNDGNLDEFLRETSLSKMLVKAVADMASAKFSQRRYMDFMMDFFGAVYDTQWDEEHRRGLSAVVGDCRRNFFADALTAKRHIFENYAVNKFFLTLCPWTNDGTYSYNCRIFVAGIKLTEFAAIVSSARERGNIAADKLIGIISYVSERLDHNRDVGKTVREFIRKREMSDSEFREMLLLTGL